MYSLLRNNNNNNEETTTSSSTGENDNVEPEDEAEMRIHLEKKYHPSIAYENIILYDPLVKNRHISRMRQISPKKQRRAFLVIVLGFVLLLSGDISLFASRSPVAETTTDTNNSNTTANIMTTHDNLTLVNVTETNSTILIKNSTTSNNNATTDTNTTIVATTTKNDDMLENNSTIHNAVVISVDTNASKPLQLEAWGLCGIQFLSNLSVQCLDKRIPCSFHTQCTNVSFQTSTTTSTTSTTTTNTSQRVTKKIRQHVDFLCLANCNNENG